MKLGAFSLILNEKEYQNLGIEKKSGKLLKLTKYSKLHNGEHEIASVLNKENDFAMCIYEETISKIDLKTINLIKEKYKKQLKENTIYFFNGHIQSLTSYFIEDVGDIDLFDTLTTLINCEDNIWETETEFKLNEFFIHMCRALNFFQNKKICHFDIKPENIVFNCKNITLPFSKKFKIIDFGFSEKYPFNKYCLSPCGTPHYIPCKFNNNYPPWGIDNNPNDWVYNRENKKHYHYILYNNHNYDLIYKTDIYSMGVTFNQLLYYINGFYKNKNKKMFNKSKFNSLIKHMSHKDIEKRFYAYECLDFITKNEKKSKCWCF